MKRKTLITMLENETVTERELTPANTKQKSFYGKAKVIETGETIYLQSYDTIVCSIDKETGAYKRYWFDWTATTGKHIKEFFLQQTGEIVHKKEWEAIAA